MHRLGMIAITMVALVGVADARPKLSSREFGDLKKGAQRALKTGAFGEAAGKIRALAEDDSKRAIDLCAKFARVPDAEVYNACRDAVAGMDSTEAKEHILKQLGRGGSAVGKMLLVDAMAKRGDAFAGEALGAACTAKQAAVQRAAISAIKRKKLYQGLGGLIDLLEKLEKKDDDGLNANMVRDTLYKISGESIEKAVDWRKWWSVQKSNFRPVTGKLKPKSGGTARRNRPRFFGSEIKSNRLVFVIDVSGSMTAADPPSGGGATTGGAGGPGRVPTGGAGAGQKPQQPGTTSRVRIERAKDQLKQVIEALPGKARFTILAYSGVLMMGPGGKPALPKGSKPSKKDLLPPKMGGFEWLKVWKPKLMPASSGNKEDAKKFVSALQANGGTFTLNALRHAMEVDGADTVVVLSDGFPNDVDMKTGAQMDGKKILDQVAQINRFKRRVIDTFGFDPSGGQARRGGARRGGFGRGSGAKPRRAGFGGGGAAGGNSLGKFMQDLAKQNGGDYTQIK